MSDERFYVDQFLDIIDTLEPWKHRYKVDLVEGHPQELCDLLNVLDERANRNAELLDQWMSVLYKYGITTPEKLDKVLMEQRVW